MATRDKDIPYIAIDKKYSSNWIFYGHISIIIACGLDGRLEGQGS